VPTSKTPPDAIARRTCPAATPSVWYQWTAPGTGVYEFDTHGSRVNTMIGAYANATLGNPQAAIGDCTQALQLNPRLADAYSGRAYARAGLGDRPGAIADRGFTPNQYLDAYGYSPLHAEGIDGQGERVSLIEIDGFRYSDLRAFASCFGLAIPAIDGFGVNIKHPLTPIGETELDLQLLDAAAPDLKAIDVYESRARPADVLQSLTAPLQIAGQPVVNLIASTSGSATAGPSAMAIATARFRPTTGEGHSARSAS